MSAWTAVLRVGLALVFDGEQFTVAEIEGRRILLRQVAGGTTPGLRRVDVSMLLSHPTARILYPGPFRSPVSQRPWTIFIILGAMGYLTGFSIGW